MRIGKSGLVVSLVLLALTVGCASSPNSGSSTARKPDDAVADYVQLGLTYLRNGQRDQARANIQRALDINSRSAEANHAMALVNQVEGEMAAADDRFKKAISSDSSFTQGRYNYANFLMAEQRFSEARDQYHQASLDLAYRLRPEVFVGLGRAENRLGNSAAASLAFESALRLNPRLGIAWLELAQLEHNAGRFEQASRLLEESDTYLAPSARSLWLGVQIYTELNDSDKVASFGLALKNLFPESQEARLYLESSR